MTDFDIVTIDQTDKSPAKYWIRFLLSRQKHTVSSIEAMLAAIQLGGIDADYIRGIKASMQIPRDFQPTNLQHRPSQRFLRNEGIYEAWHRPPIFTEAFDILGNSELRALVETYILSPLRPHQALIKIEQCTGVKLRKKVYLLFEHYWWNRGLLSGADWGDYIIRRDVAHHEWLQLAVNATGASGAQMLMWKTGALPRLQLEAGRIFKDMRNIAYMCFMQRAYDPPSLEHSKSLLNYARTATAAQQQVDASQHAMADVVEHFNQFRMKREKVQTPAVQQLTGGNYSTAEDAVGENEKLEDL
jgi:hypothetical protein